MKTLVDHLSAYAAFHRDARNIATHVLGVPVIVLSVLILLSRNALDCFGIAVTPALVVYLLSSVFYLRLSVSYGLVLFVFHGMLLLTAGHFATVSTPVWLVSGVSTFVLGWMIQFLGHHYEGRSPAFFQDWMSLLIGPLFVVVELGCRIGFSRPLQQEIEARVGPVCRRGES